jgi:transcriptional regulator with XRE-family HTH domain
LVTNIALDHVECIAYNLQQAISLGECTMARLNQLQEFQGFLRSIDHESRADFQKAVSDAMSLLTITDTELSMRFNTSRSSVNRWRNGNNAPFPSIRKLVYTYLLKKIASAIEREQRARQEDDNDSHRITRSGSRYTLADSQWLHALCEVIKSHIQRVDPVD